MISPQQAAGYREQPRIPSFSLAALAIWTREQPAANSYSERPASSVVDDPRWRAFNMVPSRDGASTGLEDAFIIENRPEVAKFIEQNHLAGMLRQATRPLDATFGENTLKMLRLVRDDEGSETLFCFVATRVGLEVAMQALRRFDELWWIARCGLTAGRLNFDFELF
jgi:hypothetical protein